MISHDRLNSSGDSVGMALHHRDSTGDVRCFVCDEIITGTWYPLVVGVTPYSKTDIPTKIGQLMGEGFMVVVSEDDKLCKRCTSLLNELDRLEVDLNSVKDALTNYLKVKYQLHEEDYEIPASKDETNILFYNEEENDKNSSKKLCDKGGEIAADNEFKGGSKNIPEILSRATKSPKKVNVEIILDGRIDKSRKKRRRTTKASRALNDGQSPSMSNEYKCSLGELTTPDISAFKAHCCNKYEDIICKNDYEGSQYIQKHVKNAQSVEWTCRICSMIFKEENMLTSHMQIHSHDDMVQHKMQNGQPIDKKTNIFSSGVGLYTCSICNFKTESVVTYREHHQAHFQNPSEYRASHKRPDDQKSRTHSINSTEKASEQTIIQEKPTCNLRTVTDKDLIRGSTSKILPSEDEQTVDINYKITESQKLCDEDSIPKSEHYVCSSCSLVFPSDRLLQHHKNMHHVLTSLTKDTLLTTEITSNNFNDLQQKGCLDTNMSSNLNINNEDLTDIFKKVSSQFMKVPNTKFNNFYDTEITSEHVSRRMTSDSATCTNIDCDSRQLTDDEIDHIAAAKAKQHSATTHNSAFEKSNEQLLTPLRSHSSEALQVDNRFQSNSAINKAIANGRTYSTVKENENSEKNVTYNSSLENLLHVQRNALLPGHGTESTRQKVCVRKAETDSKNSRLDSSRVHDSKPQSMKDLRTPYLSNATKAGTPQCENCGKLFSSNSKMLYHRDICSKNLTCKLCNKHFLSVADVLKHNSEEHPTHDKHHNCKHCSILFPTKELCLAHEENCEYAPYCDECGETFSKLDQLRSHKDTSHRDPHCRYCGKEILKLKTLRNHELRHVKESEEKFECSECKKVFKTKTGLRHHFALHTGQYKFCCDYCGRGFMSRMMMEEHRSKHTKEERYVCDVCGRKFCFQSTYWIHRKWHDNPFPYKCNFCGRKFRHSSLLAVHKRKHTGERPYKCPHCPLTFPVGGTLKRHIILHTGVYPYNCEICKRGFTTRHKFALHLSKVHGDNKMLNEKSQPSEFKMVIRDNETVKREDNLEPSAEWQNPDDSEQVDMNFQLGSSAGSVDNFEHLEGAMSCSLVPDELLVGSAFATRVVEIVLDDTSQAVAAVTVADPEANSLSDLWYQ